MEAPGVLPLANETAADLFEHVSLDCVPGLGPWPVSF